VLIVEGISVTWISFPSGEDHVRLDSLFCDLIKVRFVHSDHMEKDIMRLLMLNDALKNNNMSIDELRLDYIPYARQDRVAVIGDCVSLRVFARLVNDLNIRKVYLYDPHSIVSETLFDRAIVVTQVELFWEYFDIKRARGRRYHLVAPDVGAAKKTEALAKVYKPVSIIQCSKIRDPENGEIIGCEVPVNAKVAPTDDLVIVDDICDGGRTFIEIARKLRENSVTKKSRIILVVSHGLFTKGYGVFAGLIDEIWVRGERKI